VAPSTVGRWLSGKRDPSLENVEVIAAAVGMTASELVADPERKPDNAEPTYPVSIDDLKRVINELHGLTKKGKKH
jgi:transcriptional regulator with XRE-family HTH domain